MEGIEKYACDWQKNTLTAFRFTYYSSHGANSRTNIQPQHLKLIKDRNKANTTRHIPEISPLCHRVMFQMCFWSPRSSDPHCLSSLHCHFNRGISVALTSKSLIYPSSVDFDLRAQRGIHFPSKLPTLFHTPDQVSLPKKISFHILHIIAEVNMLTAQFFSLLIHNLATFS
jgi:hypothetical protein